jgi:DNA repair protein RecN (Recombination protein N)
MLNRLRIENIALIDELEVKFGRGLNVLTGSTGPGNR